MGLEGRYFSSDLNWKWMWVRREPNFCPLAGAHSVIHFNKRKWTVSCQMLGQNVATEVDRVLHNRKLGLSS